MVRLHPGPPNNNKKLQKSMAGDDQNTIRRNLETFGSLAEVGATTDTDAQIAQSLVKAGNISNAELKRLTARGRISARQLFGQVRDVIRDLTARNN